MGRSALNSRKISQCLKSDHLVYKFVSTDMVDNKN